ncbi:hypothetical protein MTO96_017696 [Rhipicephalus appendiculatus]
MFLTAAEQHDTLWHAAHAVFSCRVSPSLPFGTLRRGVFLGQLVCFCVISSTSSVIDNAIAKALGITLIDVGAVAASGCPLDLCLSGAQLPDEMRGPCIPPFSELSLFIVSRNRTASR